MKNILIPACLALLCLTSCTDKKTPSWQMREMSMANLQEQFADPGKEYIYYISRKGYNSASSWTAGFPYVDITAPGVT